MPRPGLGDYTEPRYTRNLRGANVPMPPGLASSGAQPWQSVREYPFDQWYSRGIGVTNVAVRLDNVPQIIAGRRAIIVENTDIANGIWLGSDPSVRVGDGWFLRTNGGAISLPLSEKAQVWAIAGVVGPVVVSVAQFV